MKNNKLLKFVMAMLVVFFVFTYYSFQQNRSKDLRMDVQAVYCYTQANDSCAGSCPAGFRCIGYGGCYCDPIPIATSTPTPTPLNPCDTGADGDGSCSASNPISCEKTSCSYTLCVDGKATKCIRCSQDNCPGICSAACGIPDTILCGYCVGALTPTPTQPAVTCQPFSCHNTCGLAGCPPDYCGSQDGCGGYSCTACGGGEPITTAPTAIPTDDGCTPNCANDPCRTNLCSDQICTGTCGGNCIGALTCNVPYLSDLIVKNADEAIVSPDTNDRNHICESIFSSSSNSRRIILEASVHDSDGYDNIASVEITWAGIGYTMDLDFVDGSGDDALYTKTVDFGIDDNNDNTWPIEIKITDDNGKTTGWVSTGREFKVWDCNVTVSGALYDGSGGQACNTTGFMGFVDASLGYSSLLFRDTLGGGVSATAIVPFSFGPNNLIWNRSYLPIFNGGDVANPNGDLLATGRMTRITDLGVGTTSCPTTEEFDLGTKVSAYSTNPSAYVDFSFIRTQDGWFQVIGAGVKAKNQLASGVPITAPLAIRALTLSRALADNGLVSFTTFSNINGFNESSGYGMTNNWWINRSTNDATTYNYQYFYNNLFVNRDLGTTGTDWASKPSEGIYYVNGNLTIDNDFTLAAGKTLLVVVRGTITISDTVDRVDGIFIADGGITASGSSANQLVINGVLYSKGNIQLSRSYTDKLDNNSSSAVVVNYQPNLIFNLPGTVMRVLSGWKEE